MEERILKKVLLNLLTILSYDERIEKWYEHFSNLLRTDQYPENEEFIPETIITQNELNIPETEFTST